jgi:hypothetical protein
MPSILDVTREEMPIQGDSANDLSGRAWNLLRADEDNPVKQGYAKVSAISFEGYASADDHCLVKDGKGVTVFETYGNTDLSPILVNFTEPAWLWNLTLCDLGSGRCVVHTL